MANSVDLDETDKFEQTNLFLHNLQRYIFFFCRFERGIHQIQKKRNQERKKDKNKTGEKKEIIDKKK